MNNSVMKDLSLFRRGVSVSVYEGASVATAVSILLIFLFRIFKFRFFASPSPSIPDSVSLAQIQSRYE